MLGLILEICFSILSLSSVLRFIFPDTFPDGERAEEVAACVSANLPGVSNVATPFAPRAMKKMASSHGKLPYLV